MTPAPDTRDKLMDAARRLYAVIVRGAQHATATVLEKHGDSYDPVAQWPVRAPATQIEASAYEDPTHRLLAVVAHTGQGATRQAHLVILPLTPTATTQP